MPGSATSDYLVSARVNLRKICPPFSAYRKRKPTAIYKKDRHGKAAGALTIAVFLFAHAIVFRKVFNLTTGSFDYYLVKL